MITGQCFCGSVQYAIGNVTPKATICHCDGCRKASAAPAVAWITVPAAAFHVLQGELRMVRGDKAAYRGCDGCGGERGFCPVCGTHISFIGDDRRDEIDITTGSLDTPGEYPPVEDSFVELKIAWMPALAR